MFTYKYTKKNLILLLYPLQKSNMYTNILCRTTLLLVDMNYFAIVTAILFVKNRTE